MSQPVGTLVFDFHHPEQNFGRSGREEGRSEAEFGKRFVELYSQRFEKIHARTQRDSAVFVRELPVPASGIADLVVISWKPEQLANPTTIDGMLDAKPVTRAFEFKLSDWRKGLMQAHRYKYFADASILVLPDDRLRSVEPHLEMFHTLRVGLWIFSAARQILSTVYTPRPNSANKTKNSQLALRRALSAFLDQPGLGTRQ